MYVPLIYMYYECMLRHVCFCALAHNDDCTGELKCKDMHFNCQFSSSFAAVLIVTANQETLEISNFPDKKLLQVLS